MTGALVSVVIPCYNVEKYIDECLGSVFTQTYASLEVFCVDDGSKDNLPILRRFEAKGRIRPIEGEHSGAGAARDQGLVASTGRFVQFLDADELLEPEKIGCQVGMLEEAGPDVPFLAGKSWIGWPGVEDPDLGLLDSPPLSQPPGNVGPARPANSARSTGRCSSHESMACCFALLGL